MVLDDIARLRERAESGNAQGDPDAQHNLALMTWHGKGVKKDRRLAYRLMDRALADPDDFDRALRSTAVTIVKWGLVAVATVLLLRLAFVRLME